MARRVCVVYSLESSHGRVLYSRDVPQNQQVPRASHSWHVRELCVRRWWWQEGGCTTCTRVGWPRRQRLSVWRCRRAPSPCHILTLRTRVRRVTPSAPTAETLCSRAARSQAATRAFRGLELAAKKERLQQMSSELTRAGLQTPAAAEPSQWT
eukprot:3067326-Prymnesium_polylepis.1